MEAWNLGRMQEVYSSLIVHTHHQGPKDCHTIFRYCTKYLNHDITLFIDVSYHSPETLGNEGSRMPRKMIIARFHVNLPSPDDLHPHTRVRVLYLYVQIDRRFRIGPANS